jgi:4-amino-4-deoxy-L-arabinose transferase-like glycosyltransferase
MSRQKNKLKKDEKMIQTTKGRINDMAVKKYCGLAVVIMLLNGIVYFYYMNNTNLTDGSYIYPLDDTYIHLAMAKNVVLYNNWGVVYNEFSSTSSSPVYTLLLSALIRVFGNSSLYPLLVNIFFGNGIIFLLFWFFGKNYIAFFCSCLFFFSPVLLHVQILSGMEHTLHIFLILAVFMLFYKYLENKGKKHTFLFLVAVGLLCLTRYESMFFIIPTVIVLALCKQYKLAVLTFAAGFLPVLIFGLYSVAKGGFFFPNSLLVKGDISFSKGIFYIAGHYIKKFYLNIFRVSFFIAPLMILLDRVVRDFIVKKQYNLHGLCMIIKDHAFVFISVVTLLLHGFFAGFGWLYRYEAYLLSLLYISLVITIAKNIDAIKYAFKKKMPSFLSMTLILIAIFEIASRYISAHATIQVAGKNIYDQQIQMSRFLHTYYNESKVMANDIGAITYYTKIDLLDLVGLGSNSILKNKLDAGGGGAVWNLFCNIPITNIA